MTCEKVLQTEVKRETISFSNCPSLCLPEICCHCPSYLAFGSETNPLDIWILEIKHAVLRCTRIKVLCVNVINTTPRLNFIYLLSFTRSNFLFNNSKLPERNIENCQHLLPHPHIPRCEGRRQVAETVKAKRGSILTVARFCCSAPLAYGLFQA